MAKSEPQSELLARIDERLQAQTKAMHAAHNNFSADLKDILTQVKITNGRVTVLENWRSKMKGVWLAVTIAGLAIVTIIGWILTVLSNNKLTP